MTARARADRRGADLMTEDQLLAAVLDLAHLYGWKVVHFRPGLTARGYRTPVAGDGQGFPDLLCVHRTGGALAVELKDAVGAPDPLQTRWLALLAEAGVPSVLWRPADFASGAVARTFREGPRR